MAHDFLMRSRTRTFTLSALLVLLTLLLYLGVRAPQSSLSGNGAPLPPVDGASMKAMSVALDDLDVRLKELVNSFDFAAKGDRVAAFADLLTNFRDQAIGTNDRFNALVAQEFPWWTSVNRKAAFRDINGETGIVVCVGSKDILLAGHLIRTLRNVLKSTLPIQIAYAGDGDLSRQDQKTILELDSSLELVNLLNHFNESVTGLQDGKYAMKPFAVIASRFQKTILVDADVIFMQNPDTLFQVHESLERTGSLFYHDRAYKMQGQSRAAWVRTLLGSKAPSSSLDSSLFWNEDLWQEMESGVVAFDKGHSRILITLLFTAWMNTKEIREKETYVHVLGDKETYWLASELAATPYEFQPDYAGLVGALEDPATTSKICSAHILHMDHTGNEPFWFNGGLLLNKALAGGELVTLTHYTAGGVTWADQPSWRYDGNEYWCAEGKPAIALAKHELDVTVNRMMEEAQKTREAITS